jgi:vacuolar protein sorting-associated protein 54
MRRRRLNDLDVALDRVKEILRAVEQAEDLGEAGETEGALDLADEIEKEWEMSLSGTAVQIAVTPAVEQREEPIMSIISEENEDDTETDDKSHRVPATPMTALRPRGYHHAPVRIANIKCLADIPMRLGALRSAIAQTLEHELVAVLVHAIREGGEALSSCTEQWRTSPGARAPIYDELRDSYASRARSCLHGLVRCGKPALDDAIIAWKAALLKEVRKTVRDLVPSSGQHDDDDTPADNTPSSRSSAEGKRPSLDGM